MVHPDVRSESDKSPASRELDRRSRQQADVARLGVLALSGIPLADLFGEALRSLRTHLGAPLAAIISLDGESARLVAADGFFPRLDAIAVSSDSLADLLRRTGEAVVVSDLSRETRFRTSLLLQSMGAGSGIAVPLRAAGGTIGGLTVGDAAARDYPVEDADFLQSVANVLSAAELRSQKDEQLRHSQSRWRTLVDTANEGVWTIDEKGRVNITAHLEAAESVEASERFFRSMIENSMVSVAVVDAQSRYTYVSPNVLPLLGYEHEELRGRSPFDFLHPDDTSTGHAAIEEACSAPGAVSFARVRFLHKDGSWRWIDASVRHLLHDDVVHGIVLNWHDVTERYQAEQALRQSEEKLRQAQKIEG